MKKIALLLVLVVSVMTTASAKKFIKGQYYGGIALGIEDYSYYSHYDPGMTLVLNGGKPIIKLGPGTIGAELELTYTVLPMDYYRYGGELSVLTFGTYATYTFTHSKKLYSRAKLGFALQSYGYDYDYYDYYYDDYNNFAVAVGIGGGYKFNKTVRAYSDLIIMSGGLKQLNFGVQFSF